MFHFVTNVGEITSIRILSIEGSKKRDIHSAVISAFTVDTVSLNFIDLRSSYSANAFCQFLA